MQKRTAPHQHFFAERVAIPGDSARIEAHRVADLHDQSAPPARTILIEHDGFQVRLPIQSVLHHLTEVFVFVNMIQNVNGNIELLAVD